MDVFQGQNLLEFINHFQTDHNYKEYLSKIKRKNGFKCLKCEHSGFQIRKNFARTCNKCSHREIAPSNT